MAYHRCNGLRRNGVLLLVFMMSLLLAACEEQQQQERQPASVTYLEIKAKPLTLTTELSGRTSAFMVSEVRPQVTGIIQERLFNEGTDVKKGDVLYQIDPALYEATYANALATLQRAEANVKAAALLAERYEKIVKLRAVSKQEYDNAVAEQGQAEAEVAAAKAALDSAKINLEYTKVTAPVSGRIGRSTVTQGALVTQNQAAPLATVQQLDPIYVDVTQSSVELLRLKKAFASGALKSSGEGAMQASLKLEDGSVYTAKMPKKDPATGQALKGKDGKDILEEQTVLGTLKFSEVTVEQSTGVVTIRAIFPNPEGTLLPGMYVRAVLEEGVNENAILIPQKTVVRNNRGLPVVQVLNRNGTAAGQDLYMSEARIISVDRPMGNDWLVNEGLKAGERIVLIGLQKVGREPVFAHPEGAGDSAAPMAGENAPGTPDGKSQ